ncbi:hypothetical protein IJ843_05495 [bacterium]|nr:hypothetical protein [bacterium]
MNTETIKTNKDNNNPYVRQKNGNRQINTTLQGVLVNSHLRAPVCNDKFSFNDIEDSLLISKSDKYYSSNSNTIENKESAFDVKKAIVPLLAGTTAIAGGCYAFSACLKHSSQGLLKAKRYEQLPDLAINMNIREEPQFAIYRAIRDPNSLNIIGAAGVFIMSGITLACKNFVDGAKEIWVKKRNADIEKNLQENLISVDRDMFSGKLKVVNDMMNENVAYFDEVLNSNSFQTCPDITSFTREKQKTSNIFDPFITSFKGEEKKEEEKNAKDEKLKYAMLTTGVIAGSLLLGKLSYSNINKTINNAKKFADNYSLNTINAIENISKKGDKKDIPTVVELMKSISVKKERIKEVGDKYGLKEDEIQNIISEVEQSKKTIFADAPTALGGIPKKVQYYCYIDEPRGHLYNWLLNPQNKFTKQIFAAFTASSALGYLFEKGMEAIKETAVMQENAKTELDLKKRLVAVEIESFKQKKTSAISPLIDNFTKQANNGTKSKKELKQIADNILMEIKNGPPYVYN